jgi:MFS family permease
LRWLMLLILFGVRLAMGFQFQSVASTSAQLVDSFGLSYAEVGTLIGFFLLPGVFISIPSGALTRAVSDKNLLMVGAVAMVIGSAAMLVVIAGGTWPEASLIFMGIIAGIPAGALMALSAEAVSRENRGPGLGIYYTWYYLGMTLVPGIAGGLRDATGSAMSPLLLGTLLMVLVVSCVLALRVLQAKWPIRTREAGRGA